MMDHNNEGAQDFDMDQREVVENQNKFTISNLNLK